MVVQHRFPLLLRKLDPETSISTPVPTRLFHRGSDYSHPRNLYSHARNPYSHPPGISIHIAPESVFTCPGIRNFALASDPEGWRGPQMSSGVGTLWRRRRVERRTAVVVRCHSNRLPAMPLRTNQQSAPYHETVEGVPAENPPLRDGIVRNPFFAVNY